MLALMSHVKHERIPRSLKDTVECYRQLDRTEIGGKMTSCFGYAVQQKPDGSRRRAAGSARCSSASGHEAVKYSEAMKGCIK